MFFKENMDKNKIVKTKTDYNECLATIITKDDLFFDRYYQFVRAKDDLYFGAENYRFYYSKMSKGKDKVMAILPTNYKGTSLSIYQRDNQDNMINKSHSKIDKKKQLHPKSYCKNVKTIDLNFSYLYELHRISKAKGIKEPYLVFSDGNIGEPLYKIIYRASIKRYIHEQLIEKVKIISDKKLSIVNEQGKTIAVIVSKDKFIENKYNEYENDLFNYKNNVEKYKYGRSQ